MTNCSNVWRGLKLRGASAGSALAPSAGLAVAVRPPRRRLRRPRRPRRGRRHELDRGARAEHGAGAALEQIAEALLDPRPDPLGRDDDERPVLALVAGERLEPLVPGRLGDRPLQLCADPAPAGWVLVVGHGRVERPPRAEARWWNGESGGGPVGPGTANIARGSEPVSGLFGGPRKSRGKGHRPPPLDAQGGVRTSVPARAGRAPRGDRRRVTDSRRACRRRLPASRRFGLSAGSRRMCAGPSACA